MLFQPEQFVRALPLPAGFSVCELGDQWVTHTKPFYPSREFYVSLGCTRYEAIDGNGRGTITFDLNRKWTRPDQFDLVTDFGTGEHIFNQAQVWRTVHMLTKVGGFIVFDRPSAGYVAHCFYLITPELLRDIADVNGYRIVALEHRATDRGELWRGVFQRTSAGNFHTPQQSRYRKSLKIRSVRE